MSERYLDIEIIILTDLNHLKSKHEEIDLDGYMKGSKELFDFSKYKKIGDYKIDISLSNLLSNGHIKYKTGNHCLPKYENLIKGLFCITDYGRTMLDLNGFSNHIYQTIEHTSNDWKNRLKNLNEQYLAQIITIFGLFIAVFSFILTVSKNTINITIPITEKGINLTSRLGADLYWQVILLKSISVIPLALILFIFICAIYFVFKR